MEIVHGIRWRDESTRGSIWRLWDRVTGVSEFHDLDTTFFPCVL